MSVTNSYIITEDISRDVNSVGIQIHFAKTDAVDILQVIREKEELKQKLEAGEEKINSLRAKQYDLMTKLEDLQKCVSK